MEDIYEKVLFHGYGLKLYNITRTRRGLIVKTDKGLKELRKTNRDFKTIEFENEIKKHLYNKGFRNTDIYLETKDGMPYFVQNDQCFVMSEYVPAKEIDLEDLETAKKSARTLATIHSLSQGLTAEGKSNLGRLTPMCQKRRAELRHIKKWINNQSKYSPVDIIVVKSFDYFLERTGRTENILTSSAYQEITRIAKEKGTVCHLSYKGDNIRQKEDSDKLYITGFDKSAYDCTVWDLAEFIRRQIKSPLCTEKTVDEVLKSYTEVLNIGEEEVKVLGAMVLFPAKYFKLLNGYYNKRKVCQSDFVRDKLERCIMTSRKEETVLKALGMM
jgi:spore coat protein, CotS family